MNDDGEQQHASVLDDAAARNTMFPSGITSEETIRAYQHTMQALESTSHLPTNISSIPSLVSLQDITEVMASNTTASTSTSEIAAAAPYSRRPPSVPVPSAEEILSRMMYHQNPQPPSPQERSQYQFLYRALERLEQPPSSSNNTNTSETSLEQTLLKELTELIADTQYASYQQAEQALLELGQSIPRRVCQHPFKRNDIVWVCRTCQADETCVLCHACFKTSNHEGHDVAFYHAQAGGCCDCGDPDAWDSSGFCPRHGPQVNDSNDESLPTDMIKRVEGLVSAVADWLVRCIASQQVEAHQRAQRGSRSAAVAAAPRFRAASDIAAEEQEIMSLGDYEDEDNTEDDGGDEGENNVEDEDVSMQEDTPQEQAGLDPVLVDMGHVFLPAAASTSRSRHGLVRSNSGESLAQQLGMLGRKQHGIYIVLHIDEIHSLSQIQDALLSLLSGSSVARPRFFTDSLLQRIARVLKQHGQIVVWGTAEMLQEVSSVQADCWKDGDRVASELVGGILLQRVSKLVQTHEMSCSVVTRSELRWEQRAVAVLQWLGLVARSCDPLCTTVASCLQSNKHLVPLLKADFSLGASITKAWHSLLLTLLSVPVLKRRLAAAYTETYQYVTAEYARGKGTSERSGYTLSVQFLNRVTYVVDLVVHRDLLGTLGKALLETLSVAATDDSSRLARGTLDPNNFVLTHRRYSPCICDLKCVLNVHGIPRMFFSSAGTFLTDWMRGLALGQGMDGQIWRTHSQGHVETEPRGWVGAFNASISLASLYDRLLHWNDDDPCPVDPKQSPLARTLPTAMDATFRMLRDGVAMWQREAMESLSPLPGDPLGANGHRVCLEVLPFSTLAAKYGTPLALHALPIAQSTRWSFHLPLHRFVAASLREVNVRPDKHYGASALLDRLQHDLKSEVVQELFRGLMEFPILVLSRAAQIRAGLWKRSGSGMRDQVLNYAEPPFCRTLRDSDILFLQFAALGLRSPDGRDIGCSVLIHLLLHRLGLFQVYLGLAPAPNSNAILYKQEASAGLYPFVEPTKPWSFSPVEDAETAFGLLEECLHLLIILVSELPLSPPCDKAEHTRQSKERLRREVIHRLASGPKTHSELTEVQHVLSYRDNTFLSEEGKLLNPDDASGAALAQALAEVAEKKPSHGKTDPDQWELRRSAWVDYDPAFYHINVAEHQRAAESRPKPGPATNAIGVEPVPYGPFSGSFAHPAFRRLQRDVTSDATVLSILYRTLHVHCRVRIKDRTKFEAANLRGPLAYDLDGLSETVLARAVHLLTLGAYAWGDAESNDPHWRSRGGGATGSVFFGYDTTSPSTRDWVAHIFLADPCELMDSDWYKGEDNALQLLHRLASGDKSGVFVAQDQAVRAGAAWLCDFAGKHNPEAANFVDEKLSTEFDEANAVAGESEFERKKREAKEKAMQRMKAQADKMAAMIQLEAGDDEDEGSAAPAPLDDSTSGGESTPQRWSRPSMSRSSTFESEQSSTVSSRSPQHGDLGLPDFFSMYSSGGEALMDANRDDIPDRLLKNRPRCIICAEESTLSDVDVPGRDDDVEGGSRKRSRRKTERGNVLAFVGYAQSSTVLKGGGGPPPLAEDLSPIAAVRRFTGTHVALCGHAVHSDCCESFLTSSHHHRLDRRHGRLEEFRCPLCNRLSNCLVPFIDVGVDWCAPVGQSDAKGDPASMQLDDDSEMSASTGLISLHDFLSSTPWWVGRNDETAEWDGQCAFISAALTNDAGGGSQDLSGGVEGSPAKSRRRRIRSLRKRDLYTAWNAMMQTPRFMRKRRFRQKSNSNITDDSSASAGLDPLRWPVPDESSSGETVVWRRFMDLLSEMSYRADGKRIGEKQLSENCGEFRHYHTEKFAYNIANKEAQRGPKDWPDCLSTEMLEEVRRQELSREKLLSKLLISIQSFVYSCCSESFEARRLLQKEVAGPIDVDGGDSTIQTIFSKYGVRGTTCDGCLLLMKKPQPDENEGTQPFDGRFGKLRLVGLSLISAAGAVSADLVQLVLSLPLDSSTTKSNELDCSMDTDEPLRAPIAFPILFGHVLTHVTAAMSAACGWARARSDMLELAWPVPFSSRGSFYGSISDSYLDSGVDTLVRDCEGFIKLGLLARILQVLLFKMNVDPSQDREVHASFAKSLVCLAATDSEKGSGASNEWAQGCLILLQRALSRDYLSIHEAPSSDSRTEPTGSLPGLFLDACSVAAEAAVAFLTDAAVILQVLVPGATMKYARGGKFKADATKGGMLRHLVDLLKLQEALGLESLLGMVQSSLVHDVVCNWMDVARLHAQKGNLPESNDRVTALVQKRLFRVDGFRCYDWPMDSIGSLFADEDMDKKLPAAAVSTLVGAPLPVGLAVPLQMDAHPPHVERALRHQPSSPLVAFSSQKRVPLLGGYAAEHSGPGREDAKPRITMLPTSYTDLYAELGALCPDSEQTALCLICGEVLNAGGKGECTIHSFKCGAGSCIFFLLQECVGLLMHNSKAVYAHSPYVDSHGETPQYRGRPLNLDMDRYELLKELWSGHTNRQKVVQERGTARQQILFDYY